MSISIALAGNPNSGKTTLFNALTGSNQYVGNWPGVTVERKEALFELGGEQAMLTDLPGVYSLFPYSLEEGITHRFIARRRPDVVLNIVDATNLERNLYLTLQLLEMEQPLVVALNLMDEVLRRGGRIDCERLSGLLGAPVVLISAKKRAGFDQLFTALYHQARGPAPAGALRRYDANTRMAVARIASALGGPEGRRAFGAGECCARRDERKGEGAYPDGGEGGFTYRDGRGVGFARPEGRRGGGRAADAPRAPGAKQGQARELAAKRWNANASRSPGAGRGQARELTAKRWNADVPRAPGAKRGQARELAAKEWNADVPRAPGAKQGQARELAAKEWNANASRAPGAGRGGDGPNFAPPAAWVALKLLEEDGAIPPDARLSADQRAKIRAAADAYLEAGRRVYPGADGLTLVADARYAAIEKMLREAGFVGVDAAQDGLSDRIDRVMTHRALAFPIFLLIMGIMLMITFGPAGRALSGWVEALINDGLGAPVAGLLAAAGAPAWIRSLLLEGVIAGVGGVVTFLPQILMIFLFLSMLEDSGYMARAAFITDRVLQKFGLSGRSFIPMLMGLGCTTTAVVGARAVENQRDRRMTILLTPFMSCGAKLPVYGLFAAAFFAKGQGLVVLSLYLLGMLLMAVTGLILRKTAFREGETPFLMELPPYRWPAPRNVLRRLWERAKDFLTRAGTVIFAMSVVIWFFQSFSPGLQYVADGERSIFGALGRVLSPILAPLGFGDWRKGVALLSGLVAKEAVVSTLQVLYAAPDAGRLVGMLPEHFTPLSAYSFLVFTLLYPPCVAAIAAIRRELGSAKYTWLSIGIQVGTAYAASLIVYQIGRFFLA